MLSIKNLSIYLIKDFRTVIENFSFSLENGMKVCIIGEEGNGKSSILKAIVDDENLKEYAEISGEINKSNEVIGYLPQILEAKILNFSTKEYLENKIKDEYFDYNLFYRLLNELKFNEYLINEKQKISELSGGERIKFILLCELMKEPTCLLLDEPSNDLDINSIEWLKNFIKSIDIPIIFISHDEDLIKTCTNVVIHIEQLMRKQKPKISIEKLDYENYVENRGNAIERQERIAKKQREEFDKKQRKYQKIYERVQHEIRSTKNDFWGTELKIKMHTVKSIGKRLEKEKENLLEFPDYEEAIFVKFDENINYSSKKEILDLNLGKLVVGDKILSKDIELKVFGSDKICIIGENGVGKTTLLKIILKNIKKSVRISYMPQNYDDKMNLDMSIIDFLSNTYKKDEITKIRTYLGSMKFTADEMLHNLKSLSGGQKAKVYFLKMILENPEVLILDEPTRNLSPFSSIEIRKLLKSYKGTIISISHDKKYIYEVCNKIYEFTENGLKFIC
ncbi:MAG: ATP-binding cassette domain-containing protein [Peptoniphilaceae bacterium]|uniref:ATP-binding cassette domain-containing protein n=1 Tax=Parvimonas sp. TaxID=1944660 RepID=UPI0025CDA8D3|nr:ATP-binding cassette domain-containing protein [Parvimonas sp.]MCI5997105.1 ATP-binding cassette domain-containing protein [Parvimonas sp.]MDD7764786.1 ATP-binding cassette domain-containing protein [Peptoniphilaceae bacterium]MDY3050880.1 ATP-binding cassette domain-containing protein [Parvimonas sp.]